MKTSTMIPTHEELETLAGSVRENEAQLKQRFETHKEHFGDDAPFFSAATADFWLGVENGQFTLSQCKCCDHVYFPPRVICPKCWATDSGQAIETPGKGTLVTFTDLHVTAPRLKEIAPLRMAVVDLNEGVRVLTWLRGPLADAASIGQKCRIVVEKILDGHWFVAHIDE